jgi:hypothetical protein
VYADLVPSRPVRVEGWSVSVDVLREVFRLSQSRGVARNVLTVLADAAHPDGVTWLPIVPSKDGDPSRCLTHRANASRRAVIDAVDQLRELGEVEVRQAQRGRRRFNVYRVRVGAIALTAVDYADLPFDLDSPFADGVQNPHLVTGEPEGVDEVQFSDDGVQFSSRRGADFVTDDPLENIVDAGGSSVPAAPEASNEALLEAAADQDLEQTFVAQDVGGRENPAAERPVSDAAVTEAVLSLPGADIGSPRVVIPEAHGLPAATFAGILEKVRERRGRVGLLVDLLRIARAERTAALSAQLARELGQHAQVYVPAPWLLESLKRDDPERYVRAMAANPQFPIDLLGQVFDGRDDAAVLVELARRVRAGVEPADPIGTPEQERRRWVEAHATDPDVDRTIDAWDDVDPVEREELHELAERLLRESTTSESEAA